MPIEVVPAVESITIIINLRESLGCLILMLLFFFDIVQTNVRCAHPWTTVLSNDKLRLLKVF